MPKLRRTAQAVEIVQPGFRLKFPGVYGCIPLEWYGDNDIQVVHAHPGEGAQVTWDTGQDPTPAGANGNADFAVEPYYVQEESFVLDMPGQHEALYAVGGLAPYFWISHDPIDDSIPTDPRGPHGWSLFYNNFLNLDPEWYRQPGTPVLFVSKPAVTSGILLLGNEIVGTYNPTAPWNERVCRTENGNVAFRIQVSMKDAPADAIAAVYFRANFPIGPADNIHTAYAAPKAALFINKFGGVELHVNGNVTTILLPNVSSVVAALNSELGVMLEARTMSGSDQVEIYVNKVFRGSFPVSVRGPHFGLFASCSPGGRIRFSHRDIFDTGTRYSARYRTTPRNTLLWESSIFRCAEPYTAPFYRTNMPVAFTHPGLRESVKAWDWGNQERIPPSEFVDLDQYKALYSGKADGSAGVFVRLHAYDSSWHPHAGLWPYGIALNALPQVANYEPVDISHVTMIGEWAPKVRLDLL